MTTAVDTSVLLAVFKREEGHEAWLDLMAERASAGPLVACEVVWAEVGGFFTEFERLRESLDLLTVGFDPISAETAHHAGRLFRTYREQGGPREHLIPDLLVGAHAQLQADALLAIDRGFYRRYFRDLELIRPPA
ncbi:MAG: type II toxin-antitoxin system VapC family toxin [Thermoanaerobaculia bacterium]